MLFSVATLHANPKQPWSNYQVHDTKRPHPKKVSNHGPVCTPPPADAIVLFNGTNTSSFTKNWPVKNGSMIATGADTRSKQSFGSCQLHLEWRVPANRKANGQSGANSGIFLMDRYEVQILESHRNTTYADGQAGAIYGQTPPLVNASSPQGQWQSYDIIFNAPVYDADGVKHPATITVFHNGILIHNAQTIHGPSAWKRIASYPESHPAKAPIRLQFHGDPIEFRNIWIRDLVSK